MLTERAALAELGAPLEIMEFDLRAPDLGEVQIEVLACSVNFADTLIVKGAYQEKPQLPFAPGMEVVGIVKDASDTINTLKTGQKVLSYVGFGGMSRHLNVPADLCIPIFDEADPVAFASLPIAYGTSHLALFHRAKLQQNETLVVLGASGGVGLTAVELGALAGAKVIACARGQEKLEVASSKGAHHLIDTEKTDIKEAVRELGGADVVFDPVGGAQFNAALRACKPEARVLPLGFASGDIPQIPANILLVKNISVLGFYWGGYRKFAPEVMNDSIAQIIEWAQKGHIKPHVSHVLPLERANEALALLSDRKATGKVVVDLTLTAHG